MVNATEVGTYRSGMSNSPDPSTVQQSNSMPHQHGDSKGGSTAPGNTNETNANQTASTPTPNGASNGFIPLQSWAAQVGESTPSSGDPTDSDDFGKSGGKGQEKDNGNSTARNTPLVFPRSIVGGTTTTPPATPPNSEHVERLIPRPIPMPWLAVFIGIFYPTPTGKDDVPYITVYKALRPRTSFNRTLVNGFEEQDYSGGDGFAYFALDPSYAEEYCFSYRNGVIAVTMFRNTFNTYFKVDPYSPTRAVRIPSYYLPVLNLSSVRNPYTLPSY